MKKALRLLNGFLYWATMPHKVLEEKIRIRELEKMIERGKMEADYIRRKDGMK